MTDTLDRIELDGYINDEGQLEVELPRGLKSVNVHISMTVEKAGNGTVQQTEAADELPFTDEELKELMTFKYRNPQEVIAEGLLGGLEDAGIEDSVEWVNNLRRKEENRRDIKW